jgi:3D (Asp-Asp-Asp) domain-containing protein
MVSAGGGGSGSSAAGNSAGASNSASVCPAVTACGGELMGDWSVEQVCISPRTKALDAICAGATFSFSPLTTMGAVSFKADNTMTSSAVASVAETIQFPASCYTQAKCTTYAADLSATPSITNSRCNYDANTGCTCYANDSQVILGSGTYQVQGTQVTVTDSASGRTEAYDFCVSGNTLSFYQLNPNGTAVTMVLTE